MAKQKTQSIRNIALIGHGGVGKTTLVEQVLHMAGMTKRLGSVDQKNSHLDYDDEERQRGFTIDASPAYCQWKDNLLQFVDTPGYPDFIAAAAGGLKAVETAAVVINASAGIEVNTRRVWKAAEEEGMARIIIFNKMDGENVDFNALVDGIREAFGQACVPFNLPVMSSGKFSGVVDVISFQGDAPDGVVGDPEEMRASLVESVVETDEALMERYLNEEEISAEELAATFCKAIAAGTVIPIFCCSANTGDGINELIDALIKFCPSPEGAAPKKALKGEEEVELKPDPSAPLAAHIFKTVTDPFVGKMSYARVFSGTLNADSQVYNARTEKNEKVAQIMRPFGKETESITEAIPGDMVVIPKLEGAMLFDTLCDSSDSMVISPPELATPMVMLAVSAKTRTDEQKLGQALDKLGQEDASFQFERDTQTHELVIRGMSTLHLDVILSRLKRRFNVEVTTKEPKIAYRETITQAAEGTYRHKKQTGGRGQFGEVAIKVEPLERGEGFEFVDAIVGGVIPGQFIPSVEKGVRETLEKGILAGYPIDDVRVTLFHGKYHPVDSSDGAFRIAASMAFRQVFMQCKPVLLEPIVIAEITIPSQYMGDVSGDIVARRGRILGMEAMGEFQVLRAQVPFAEVVRYATELRSMTGGTGHFTMEFSHYDPVPSHVTESIIAQAKREEEEDEG